MPHYGIRYLADHPLPAIGLNADGTREKGIDDLQANPHAGYWNNIRPVKAAIQPSDRWLQEQRHCRDNRPRPISTPAGWLHSFPQQIRAFEIERQEIEGEQDGQNPRIRPDVPQIPATCQAE